MRQALMALMVAAVGLGWGVVGWAGEQKAEGLRVGTFEPRSVALAYGRSGLFQEWFNPKKAEHAKAKEAGDNDRVKQLEAEFRGQQENGHRQVFGTGPYDSLVEQLKPVLAEVAKSKDVSVIVPKVYYAKPGVQTVDVTAAILVQLKVDEKTQKIIDEMNEKIRTGEFKPEEYKGEVD